MSKNRGRRVVLREKTSAALREELLALHREHFNLRMQKAAQQTAKTGELRRVRRDIARALTILSEKTREARA
ncbi:MAG: 50S ribosomal protein L29 [Gammaproteobacteria bacterium]